MRNLLFIVIIHDFILLTYANCDNIACLIDILKKKTYTNKHGKIV